MRYLPGFLLTLLLLSTSLILSPATVRADYEDCDAEQYDLPRIPIEVDKTRATNTETVKVTLLYEQMEPGLYDSVYGQDANISINIITENGDAIYTDTPPLSYNKGFGNEEIEFTGARITENTTGLVRVGIWGECDGGLEDPTISIQYTINTDTASRIPEGEACDPGLQDDPGNPQFDCENDLPCVQSNIIGDSSFVCGEREGIPIDGSCFNPEILIHSCPSNGDTVEAEACTGDEAGQVKCTDTSMTPCLQGEGESATVMCWKSSDAPTPTPTPPFPPCLIAKNASGEMIDLRQQPERKPEAKQCIVLDTGIRPFNLEPAGLIRGLFAVLMSISGGIALLMIIRSGYQIVTSQGEAEKLKEARERLISAIVGLLFLIFSLVILETIGVDILRIPGFGS